MGDPAYSGRAFKIWMACIAILLGPSLLVWVVRGVALGAQCAPGPDLCQGMMLGGGLRDALSLAWSLGTNMLALFGLALTAAIAGLVARHPMLAASSLLLLPLAALILPMMAVYSATYDGCAVSDAGIGDCKLWGAQMGMSFHFAASVPWTIYGFAPYSFSLALMLGAVGWFLVHARPKGHATASPPRRFADDRFTQRDR
jgi:hypothetical protein